MPADEIQNGLYEIEENYSVIKHVSNIMLKCIEDGDLTKIELQSLMIVLKERIWDYNEKLQKFIRLVEYGK